MIPARDHQLPPDPDAYRKAVHPHGRIIVIAPTRAACETIELAMGLHLDTVLEREHGSELRRWAETGIGFGIVAGTGTGKTLGIRPIAESIVRAPLKVGVVNREREATPETPTWNVVIVTTGIARRWFQDDLITRRDTIVADEIHQTSAELELCLALGKRAGCRFIWLSATVDPSFYARYLDSQQVLETSAFDPALRARVRVLAQEPGEFLDDKYIRHLIKEKRGVAVFVPTRAEVEKLAQSLGERWPRLNAAFYHGGEPIRVIRPFLEGEVDHPFLLAMTAAGQSALNVRGLDTVVIFDARYGNVVDRGRNVLHRLHLGANEILQMAGRVHGRVPNGEVVILTDRRLVFEQLKPTPPEFQLAGDAERVAITCAAIGVDAQDLELPVPLDRTAYRKAVGLLSSRGLIENGRLTNYGRRVEALPVERPWGELLVHAEAELVPVIAVASSIESLHRMTREERDLHGAIVNGSDHLTAYNLYAEAVNQFGSLGSVYGLPRHVFEEGLAEWAEKRGVLIKAIEDTALGVASVYRSLDLDLPPRLPHATRDIHRSFRELIARIMPFDLVIDEHTADGQEARVSRSSVAGSWGGVAGSLRYFADRMGIPRAAIEGTTVPYELIRENAQWAQPTVAIAPRRKNQHLVTRRRLSYFGFELDTVVEEIDGPIPESLRELAREALTDGMMAGDTMHPDQGKVRRALEELGELWRRSAGTLPQIAGAALNQRIRDQLRAVTSWEDFLATRISLDPVELVHEHVREALLQLPSMIRIKGDAVALDYAIEDGAGVVRLRLREGQAHQLQDRDVPELDRPVRFTVVRGGEEAIRAASLPELKAKLKGLSAGKRRHSEDHDKGGGFGGKKGSGGKSRQRHQRRGRR